MNIRYGKIRKKITEPIFQIATSSVCISSLPEPETQVSFPDQILTVVCRRWRRRRRCCCRKLSTFSSSSPEGCHWVNFNQTWHKTFLGEGVSSLFK